MSAIKHVSQGKNNEILVKIGEKWKKDVSFFPFFYARADPAMRLLKIWENENKVRAIYRASRYILWELPRRMRKFLALQVNQPAHIHNLGKILNQKENIPVFSTDINNLLSYLMNRNKYVYEGVQSLETVIFDIECDVRFNVPFLICAKFGTFNLSSFKFEEKDEIIYEEDATTNVEKFFQDIKKRNVDLNVAHYSKFDWEILLNHARNNNIPSFSTKLETVFQGQFHGEEYRIPSSIQNFCTLLGIGIAVPRPISHDLKFITSHFELRGTKERVYANRKTLYSEFKRNRNHIIQYCLDDVKDCQLLFEYISPSCFMPAIVGGVTVEQVIFSGIKALWETLMMRRCVEEKIIIPHYESKALEREKEHANPYLKMDDNLGKAKGPDITDIDKRLICVPLENVCNVDVISAFPNITLQYNISPETVRRGVGGSSIEVEFEHGKRRVNLDESVTGILPAVLSDINDSCVELKYQKKEFPHLIPRYKGYKSIRDSHYSVSAIRSGQSRFTNRYSLALVHTKAREIIEVIKSGLKEASCVLINPDTDGVLNIPPKKDVIDDIIKDIERNLVKRFGERFGEAKGTGLDVEKFEHFFILAKKNYVYKLDGEVYIRGSLGSRSISYIEREGIKKVFRGLFSSEGMEGANKARREVMRQIEESDDPLDFAFNVFLRKADGYKSGMMLDLVKEIGDGNTIVHVSKKKGRSAEHTPKPYKFFQNIDNFSLETIDRKWYKYHFSNYLLEQVCNINFRQKRLIA